MALQFLERSWNFKANGRRQLTKTVQPARPSRAAGPILLCLYVAFSLSPHTTAGAEVVFHTCFIPDSFQKDRILFVRKSGIKKCYES